MTEYYWAMGDKERGLQFLGSVDKVMSAISLKGTISYRKGASRSLFYFDPQVQANSEDQWRVEVHFRKGKERERIGFVLRVPTVRSINWETGEISNGGDNQSDGIRYVNTYIFNGGDILHLYDGSNNLIARMTAREIAEMHEKISDEEIAEHERLRYRHRWHAPDY